MKKCKISMNIELAYDVAPLSIAYIVSKLEAVAYSELDKLGKFNLSTSFGTLNNDSVPEKITVGGPVPPVVPVPNVATIDNGDQPVERKRRRRRRKNEMES